MNFSLDKIFLFNPFAKFFRKSREEDEKRENEEIENSQGISQEQIDLSNFINYDFLASPGSAVTYIGIQFEQYFGSKRGRIQKYRQMARYPIINDALNQICDDAIVDNPEGDILNLEITEEVPEHIEDEIRKIWNYLINTVYKFNERGWDLFRKWLIEAEIYIEIILNDKGDDIVGIKILPAHTMMPVYEDSKIKAYMQGNIGNYDGMMGPNYAQGGNVDYAQVANMTENTRNIIFDKDQIAYANYGDFGINFLDVRGFLEAAIRPFNQLNNMEDAVVVNKIVRAPERRIWNIYTGRMPKGKADEFVKQLANRYKKKNIYDPATGAMNSSLNVQSLTEDYWFTKDINGNGTTVDSIGGGANSFSEMDDVKYFQGNLYKSLMLPRSRWEDPTTSMYSSGKSGEIQREEIKFARFVERLQRRFKYIILDPFVTLLRIRGLDERYTDASLFNVQYTKSNLFKEYKEMEIMESRLAVLAATSEFIYNPTENPNGYFAPEFALRRMFLMTEEEWNWNKELLDKIKPSKEEQASIAAAGGGAAGGFGAGAAGGLGGGGEFGAEAGIAPEAGAEAGVAPETVPGAAPEVPEAPPATPESKNFSIVDKDSSLLKEWKTFDESIKDRYSDNKLRNKFKNKK